MTEEGIIQKDIIAFLRLNGALVLRLNSGMAKNNVKLCPNGTPDILAIMMNKILWIEVKTKNGKLNADQIKMHAVLKAMGQTVIVARSIEDVMEAIK
jgi:Holliday junction resolvase